MSDWAAELDGWATDYAGRLAQGYGRAGVAIGGSIARGEQWEHSDLEIAVLVDTRDPRVTHFGVDAGRGVETFQIERATLEAELMRVERGDVAPVAEWPIQLWRCRVIHDPSALLGQFATVFEQLLFSPVVLELKRRQADAAAEQSLREARRMLAEGRPAAALTLARDAMNARFLALCWTLGELPRSQNRADSRVRMMAEEHDLGWFHDLYRDVFGLHALTDVIAHDWPACREQVLRLAELWEGMASRRFFELAVDSGFDWGEDASIAAVYRLYIPRIGSPGDGIFEAIDRAEWRRSNTALVRFLGLDDHELAFVPERIDRLSTLSADVFTTA